MEFMKVQAGGKVFFRSFTGFWLDLKESNEVSWGLIEFNGIYMALMNFDGLTGV